MDNFRKNYNEDIHGQWRANADEKVVYTEDFPAALLCGTEFPDNSLAKGRATKIEWTFDITDPRAGIFTITDNGVGIEKQSDLLRFLKFGSKASSDAYHQYAWGRFRAMTAFMPDYETAVWSATFKLCGNPNSLSKISHPWSTPENMQRSMNEIPIDETNSNIGLQVVIKFDVSIFGEDLATDPRKLFAKTKERLTTKYTKTVFDQTEFVLTVKNTTLTITESSRTNKWKTFKQMLEELPTSCCNIVYDETFKWKSIEARVTEYCILSFGKKKEPTALAAIRAAFPTFGTKCENSQRVHIINDGRLIESRSKPKMEGRKPDNHQNGEIVILETTSRGGDFNDQPVPSTTKVSVKDKCENLAGIYQHYLDEKKKRIEEFRAQEREAAKERAIKAQKERAERLANEKAAKEEAASKRSSSVGGGGTESNTVIKPTFQKPAAAPAAAATAAAPSMSKLQPIDFTVTMETRNILKEALRTSLKYMSPEHVIRYKEEVTEKYGFDDL
jgi:hypothetical protein